MSSSQGDLARTTSIEPDQQFPNILRIQLVWVVDGVQRIRQWEIGADEFFGHKSYGAPIPAESLVQKIEIMRKKGPPAPEPKGKRRG